MKRAHWAAGLAAGGLLLVAANQPAAPPLMAVGKRYVCLTAPDQKRTVEVVEVLRADWVRCKYTHADGAERTIWLNLGQVVYFQPAEE